MTRAEWAKVAKIALRKQREWKARAELPGADAVDCLEEAKCAYYRAVTYVHSGSRIAKEQRNEDRPQKTG